MSPPLKVKCKKILKFPTTEFVFLFYKFSFPILLLFFVATVNKLLHNIDNSF